MIRINLLPVKAARKREYGQQQLILFVVILLGIGVALYTWYDYEEQQIEKLKSEISEVRKEIKRLENVIGEVKQIKEKKAELQKRLDVIDTLKRGKTGPVRMMDDLSQRIPKKVWLVELSQDGTEISMHGAAMNNEVIANFLRALEKSPYFKNVKLHTVKHKKAGSLEYKEFELACSVVYGKAS
ncbi:MAG: hypothetical protein GXP49_00290 [Deltaproteobacteria bacterium]|nr:hypothetical protein [Deltaproteobacteria bacterium]